MVLKKKSNHNANYVFMNCQGKWNIHLLRQSNFPETMKNNEQTIVQLSFTSPSLYDQTTVLTPPPNIELNIFLPLLKYLGWQWWGTSLFRWFKPQNIHKCPSEPFLLHYLPRVLVFLVTSRYSHYQRRLSFSTWRLPNCQSLHHPNLLTHSEYAQYLNSLIYQTYAKPKCCCLFTPYLPLVFGFFSCSSNLLNAHVQIDTVCLI